MNELSHCIRGSVSMSSALHSSVAGRPPIFSGTRSSTLLAKAMAKQPAPVMAYSEFKDFEGRLATYSEQTKI